MRKDQTNGRGARKAREPAYQSRDCARAGQREEVIGIIEVQFDQNGCLKERSDGVANPLEFIAPSLLRHNQGVRAFP